MYSFDDPTGTDHPGVRDGRLAPVTCAACGCRLSPEASDTSTSQWFHFRFGGGRDARGCTVSCVGLAHDRHGMPISAS